MKRALLTAILVVFAGVWLGWPQPVLDFEKDIRPLVHEFMGLQSESSTPLEGLVVALTGATSGIGKSLTRALTGMGATVATIGRSQQKLEQLATQMNGTVPVVADLQDLASVARAVDDISKRFDKVDVLVNNAGMHYFAHDAVGEDHPTSAQGYDLVFGVNYLSHFLLTEKLMPLLEKSEKATILQVSSTYHWAVDGSDLMVTEGKPPRASVPGGLSGPWRDQRSYCNSKLAQLLHSRALVELTEARVVNVCPGFVGTNIVGEEGSRMHSVLGSLAFPVDGWGLASPLRALFDTGSDQDFYSNSRITGVATSLLPQFFFQRLMVATRVRNVVVMGLGVALTLSQKFAAAAAPEPSSPESYNASMQNSLYQWSKEAVAEWL